MPNSLKNIALFIKKTYLAWDKNDPFAKSAIIAYYTLFSLPSLLMIVTTIAGYFFGREAVEGRITQQIGEYIGPDAARAIETMISNVTLNDGNVVTIIIGLAALLYGATGVFFQMKKTMNTIWNVREKKQSMTRMFINRAISFGMVLILGFLLLISLVISAALAAFSEYVETIAPMVASITADVLKFVFSYVFIAGLFAAIFKILPDVKMNYKTTFLGAAITAALFLIGEFTLGYYFANSNPASVYGGAASVVLILLWVNYTCLILFFGAEITVQYALVTKQKIAPNKHAELAYEQQMEELKEKQECIKEDKKNAEQLKKNPETN